MMRMTTALKLWLGFGTLIGVMVLIVLTLFLWLGELARSVDDLATLVGPANRAAHTMESEVDAIGATVLDHLHAPSEDHRQQVERNLADFRQNMTDYRQLATTPREMELGSQAAELFASYEQLSRRLIDDSDQPASTDNLATLMDLRLELDAVLDEAQALTMQRTTPARELVEGRVYTLQTAALALLGAGLVAAVIAGTVVGRAVVATEADLLHSRKTLEHRVAERTRELEELNEALLHSNHELEQFASVASHDLQEPLRKIQAFGDRLESRYGDQLEAKGRQYVERMKSAAGRMRKLIDDLLSFSRVTTKAQPFEAVDLAELANEVVGDLEERINVSGGRVEIGELPAIDADPTQMRQLLQNLIGNGLKFHKPDVPPVVRVDAQLDGDAEATCELRVRDNGIGFDCAYLDRIFEVFQRLHGRQEYAGTGMGLAICRKIVLRHGGDITARSAPDEGATFIVHLPVKHTETHQHDQH